MDIDVDLARERTENPVYYVQYAHARIAGILRSAEEAFLTGAVGQVALAERELVKRLAEFPAVVAEATERRGPHALPTYAIRVADDFHRFYDHRVLESEEAVPPRSLQATASVIARSLELMGSKRERM